MNASVRKSKDDLPKMIEVASQPVHGMIDDSVLVPNVRGELYELRPVKVFAESPVDEALVEQNASSWRQLLLIERANAQVAKVLTASTLASCHFWFFDFRHAVAR